MSVKINTHSKTRNGKRSSRGNFSQTLRHIPCFFSGFRLDDHYLRTWSPGRQLTAFRALAEDITLSRYLLVVQSSGMQRHRDRDGFPESHIESSSKKRVQNTASLIRRLREKRSLVCTTNTNFLSLEREREKRKRARGKRDVFFAEESRSRNDNVEKLPIEDELRRSRESIARHALSVSGRHSRGYRG